MVVALNLRIHKFIAQAKIEREVLARAPVILGKEIEGIRAEMIFGCAELNRCLLREAKKKVCKRRTGRGTSAGDRTCGSAGEGKTAARVAGIPHIGHLPAEVCSPRPAVFAAGEADGIRESQVLSGAELRGHILQAGELRSESSGWANRSLREAVRLR